MKEAVTVRKVDELGRIVIPMEVRKQLNVNERDEMQIFVGDNCIILQK